MTIPSDLSNLALWFKADAGVYKDAGTTPAADGDTVQQWNDQSGSGNNATQSTAGSRPTYKTGILNALPVVRYGGSQFFNIARGASKTYTAFFVAKRTANGNNQSLLADTVSGGNHEIYIQRGSDASRRRGIWDASNNWTLSAPVSITQFDVYTFRRDDSAKTIDFYVNGFLTQTVSMSLGAPATGTALWMGQGTSGGERLVADVAEVVYYTDKKSDSDVAAIQNYLISKYAIAPMLVGWYLADTGVYKDAGTTLAGNGDAVQQWNDQSGLGHHLSQTATANQPVLATNQINGLPAVQFRATSSQWMQIATAALMGYRYTLFYVFKRISTTTTQTFFENGTSGSVSITGAGPQRASVNGSWPWASSDGGETDSDSVLLPTAGYEIGCIVMDLANTERVFYQALALDTDLVISGTNNGNPDSVGTAVKTAFGKAWTGGASFMNGDLAEIKLYDGRLSDTEIRATLAALAGKYNLHQPVRVYGTILR